MDLRSYIELKEAYINMMRPQTEVVSEEVEVVEEEILDEVLKGVDGKPLPVTSKDKAAVAKAKNDKAYANKAAEWKKNTGGTDYTAFKAGGGDTSKKATGMDAQRRARAGIQATQQKGRENLAKVGQRQGPPVPTGSSKPKGDLLSTLAKGGSKAAQDVQSKLSKSGSGSSGSGSSGSSGSGSSGSGSSGSGGGSRPTGGGSSRPAPAPAPAAKPTPKPTPKPQSKDMGANMRAWSKANPNLAKKVKPGQSGYKAINPQSKPSPGASAAMSAAKPAPKPNVNGMKSGRLATALSSVKKFKAEETIMNDFDIILEHLVEQGFPVEEALKLMVNMPGEKQEQILENRRAARSAGGYVDDSKKQTDPSKDGFTGISGSIKDIMRQNKEIEAKKKKMTKKEEVDSLYQAYLSMMNEDSDYDRKKDEDLERGGHASREDYSKPPTASSDDGKKRKSSMSAIEKVKADMEAKYGKGAILDTKKKD